ncbi:MAG: hypothetical protein WCH98_15150 [Verrucomicrobiota bacterium]
MKFADYVVTETVGNSVDPLGYLRPSGEVSGALFRQFTVLSNRPAYQGFLAFAFSHLARRSLNPAKRDFSRRFRDLEILWGVLNVRAGDSVLNVTKFEPLAQADTLHLHEVTHRAALYARLNYGVLGHYSSPSAFWKILEPGGSGLTALGADLASAWRYRAGQDFAVLAERWQNNEDLYAIDGLERWAEAYRLSAKPEKSEQKVWQLLIDGLCSRDPVIAPIWRNPVPADVLSLSTDEALYPGFFPTLRAHYAGHDELCRRIELCNRFERLSGLVQFVYEWEYVRRLDEIRAVGLKHGDIPKVVTCRIAEAAKHFIAGHGEHEFWSLPATLAKIGDHDAMVATILAHHTRHQRGKGASPFIAGDTVVVQDRVKAPEFVRFFGDMVSDPERLSDSTQWRYHRNWHFSRAHDWQRYAGMI